MYRTQLWGKLFLTFSCLYPISLSEHLKGVIVRACVAIHISASSLPRLKSKTNQRTSRNNYCFSDIFKEEPIWNNFFIGFPLISEVSLAELK